VRICCFGDVHYHGARKDLERLYRNIENACIDVDAIAVVGDLTSSGRFNHLEEVLSAIKGAAGDIPVLAVPGNHDLYVLDEEVSRGINSLLKLSLFNELAERLGCVSLMKRPFVLGDTAFVGSIAWYDYSFAPDWLGLSIEDFRAKAFGLYTWADREFIKLPMSNEDFTLMLLNKFEEDIKSIYSNVEKIIAVLHHLPFRRLVKYRLELSWDYFSTFMGSEAFGYVIRKYSDKIKLVLHGHQHDGVETGTCREVEGIRCCNCASPFPTIAVL